MPSYVASIDFTPTDGSISLVSAKTTWFCYGIQFPERGAIPFNPVFDVEVLQPNNVSGARYRIGGAHYPQFTMRTIMGAKTFAEASATARTLEQLNGERVTIRTSQPGGANASYDCEVILCVARASQAQVVGAADGANTQLASIEAEWKLQRAPT